MRFRIHHQTTYQFAAPVFIEPQMLRFRPRSDPGQMLESFALEVRPVPAGISEGIDPEGNAFALAWFDDRVDRLGIDARMTVRTLRTNPFDYFVLAEGQRPLPWQWSQRYAPYLMRSDDGSKGAVDDLARGLAAESPSVVEFLNALNDRLNETLTVVIRDEGEPFAPGITLASGSGSCRDLSVLFMDACRAVGVPARFVSGYQEGDPDQEHRDLHAWAEAFIPGAGWRGYDPTLGLVVSDGHIAIASAARSEDAAPVTGTFRGSAQALMPAFEISIEVLPGE